MKTVDEQALRYCDLRDRMLRLFDDGGETLYTVKKIDNTFQRAHMLKRFGRKAECFQALSYMAGMADASLNIADTEGHMIGTLNGYFETVEETEPHMRYDDVKGYVSFMLSKFDEYFEGDAGFEALRRKLSARKPDLLAVYVYIVPADMRHFCA